MSTLPAARETILPLDQQKAAVTTSINPNGVALPSEWVRITASPLVANASAAHWNVRTLSPVSRMDRAMVKKTWIWTTSEARPGVISPFIAKNSRPNCPAPINMPYAARLDKGTAGRFRKNAAGKNAHVKRSVASHKGGKWASANLMTTKFVPHTAITAIASRRCRRGKAAFCGIEIPLTAPPIFANS